MPLPPEHYIARAAEIEAIAARATDEKIRQEYLDLALKYREMGERAAEIHKKFAELDRLAENMVRRPTPQP